MGRTSLFVAQFILGVYSGYFGGAVGLMMPAVWTLFTTTDLKSMTPLHVLTVAAANGAAVVCFAVSANIRWRETLVVMAGGIAGGYIGARAGKRLPSAVLRVVILAITIATTCGVLRASEPMTRGEPQRHWSGYVQPFRSNLTRWRQHQIRRKASSPLQHSVECSDADAGPRSRLAPSHR
jgi:hypothetical protein